MRHLNSIAILLRSGKNNFNLIGLPPPCCGIHLQGLESCSVSAASSVNELLALTSYVISGNEECRLCASRSSAGLSQSG
ncbi:hypothetical protein CEXT_734841 [Caerostris extrusa]|uniref:Uncharacterized protein n=1 Tax=Caerostris extrusa TaxID=172846 RepID=A0AAV4MJP8_CAEEX|nr:hypothetical protein CEXT_734841 [Caerostris extrusa]